MTEIMTWLRRLTLLCLLNLLVLIAVGLILLRINLAGVIFYVFGYGMLIFLIAYSFYKVVRFRDAYYQKSSGEDSNAVKEHSNDGA
ncbi:hypothetical protein P3T73_13680 [Kiritimatiellota bacterium B12222]|nr:hypothetical protein P3T73_13680 [Kiritimatiellota bacterium B12222]